MAESSRASLRKFTEVTANPPKNLRSKRIPKELTECQVSKPAQLKNEKHEQKADELNPNLKETICQADQEPQVSARENSKDEANHQEVKKKKKEITKQSKAEEPQKLKKDHNRVKSKSIPNKKQNKSKQVAPTEKNQLKRAIKPKADKDPKENHVTTRKMKKSDPNYNSDVVVIEKNGSKASKNQPKIENIKQIRKLSKEPAQQPELKTRARKINSKQVIVETEKISATSVDKKANAKKKTKKE